MTRHVHPSATQIEPYQQGRLDSLCGLYALINAARLIYADAAPLTGQSCKRLFADGIDFLTAKKGSKDAAYWGMSVGRQRKLAKALLAGTALEGRPKLHLGPALPPMTKVDDLDFAIGGALARRAVLLVCLHGRVSHHSVIVGHSPDRVLLFDSDGMQFIRKGSIRFTASLSGGLILHSMIAMHLHRAGAQPAPRNT